ncbi:uncharacterized protein LOC9661179 isoform X2 [Selaginella moellendorffii]|nr:uncharacterized protein LOC9661179 isoform X2 [Selaginella moellendorffii]|eukprot:XP_024520265.1 uncharacterized protein LOC9661179 isoform X2 [Selaginella moellendorffii]
MGRTRSVTEFFQPPKRVKVGSEDRAQVFHTAAATVDGEDGSGFSFRRLSDEELARKFDDQSPAPKHQSSYSFKTALSVEENAEGEQGPSKDEKIRVETSVEERTEVSTLSKEQKMRVDMNKSMALARRKLRLCEEVVQASQGEFPDLEKLLVEPSWVEVLQDEFKKPYMENLQTFVKQQAAGKVPVYPPAAKVFNAFNSCPFDRVKVVLLGQDPYHGPGQAMGLSFSVPEGIRIPSSLLNMYKEIHSDVGCRVPLHGNLEKWAYQGVLLLNTVLTVREQQANSHAKKGWEPFTDAAIRAISKRKTGVVFLLWGNCAQEKIRLINPNEHHVLKAAHPSGLSAHKGFFGCRHFSKTNELLESANILPINWQV